MSFSIARQKARIAVIGLGYVGLPLAVALGGRYPTIGFDTNVRRISELLMGQDGTGEVDSEALANCANLTFSHDKDELRGCDVFIVAVPTPIDAFDRPNLEPLLRASRLVGEVIQKGNIVIYESTVYPGATEEDCVPVVEQVSGLTYNVDFYAGYSPERVNPGDKLRPLTKIVKVTSGSTPEAARFVDGLYSSIIEAGTHQAGSIKVAEAAKLIENVQRDVNIALMNELSIVFSHLGIDTQSVLSAAASKWNFINMQPGLVGGHCIGVDPYYMLHKAASAGYIPDIIRSAREINDGMPRHAAELLVRQMARAGHNFQSARVLISGFTFKENCPDIRNTKVADLFWQLSDYGIKVDVVDGWANSDEVRAEYGIEVMARLPRTGDYSAVVIAVAHRETVELGTAPLRNLLAPDGILFDLKAAFDAAESHLRL